MTRTAPATGHEPINVYSVLWRARITYHVGPNTLPPPPTPDNVLWVFAELNQNFSAEPVGNILRSRAAAALGVPAAMLAISDVLDDAGLFKRRANDGTSWMPTPRRWLEVGTPGEALRFIRPEEALLCFTSNVTHLMFTHLLNDMGDV